LLQQSILLYETFLFDPLPPTGKVVRDLCRTGKSKNLSSWRLLMGPSTLETETMAKNYGSSNPSDQW
jgi:hypothetical protein